MDEAAEKVVAELAERAKVIIPKAQKIATIAQRIVLENDRLSHGPYLPLEYAEHAERDWLLLRTELSTLYTTISTPATHRGTASYYDALLSDEYTQIYACAKVETRVKNGKLLIKMPLLASRYAPEFCKKNTRFSKDYMRWWLHELERELLLKEGELPHFPRRNFAYLHVVPANEPRETDNDNRDTKAVTDLVTQMLLGDDNGFETSFSSYLIKEGTLPPGTYLVVSSDYNSPPPEAALTGLLQEGFVPQLCNNS